jgi:hypothetical protein
LDVKRHQSNLRQAGTHRWPGTIQGCSNCFLKSCHNKNPYKQTKFAFCFSGHLVSTFSAMSYSVVWFKRYLRLHDHAALCQACIVNRPAARKSVFAAAKSRSSRPAAGEKSSINTQLNLEFQNVL